MPKTEPSKEKDIAYALARNVVGINYEDLPPEVVEVTKMSILDTLGVIAAASGTVPGISEMVELVKEMGGREESTIVGFGGRVPAWAAAFVNAAMGHALDYDDLHHGAMVHPSSPAVTAGFAVAEMLLIGLMSVTDALLIAISVVELSSQMSIFDGRESRLSSVSSETWSTLSNLTVRTVMTWSCIQIQ